MKQVKIYVPINGTSEKDNNILYILRKRICDVAGGCTQYNGIGVWNDKKNNNIVEDVYIFEVICNENIISKLYDIATDVGKVLNQESVLITEAHIECAFLEKGKDY